MSQSDADADRERLAVQAIWRRTFSTMTSGFIVAFACLLGALSLFPWRDSLGILYGYWAFGWFGVFLIGVLINLIRGLRATRRISKEWTAEHRSRPQ